MKVLVFGATGMVEFRGVLRAECLLAPDVAEVIGRRPPARRPAASQAARSCCPICTAATAVEPQLTGFDACFFCLGVSSVGMKEDAYRRA